MVYLPQNHRRVFGFLNHESTRINMNILFVCIRGSEIIILRFSVSAVKKMFKVKNMTENEPIKEGDNAPDFTLKDQNETEVKLSELKGKRILLSFHPLAWTPVCTKQMQSLEANYEKFQELNTVPLGLSVDSVPCKKAWAAELGLENLQILADFWPHGGVARSLGIFMEEKGISNRANIIIDEDQNVVFVKIYPIPELPDIQEILKVLEEL